jgi:hypothetical protein
MPLVGEALPCKPLERPPTVARDFVRDRRAFVAGGHNTIKAHAIAAQQLYALRENYPGKLRLTDVKELFLQMRDCT